MSASTHGEGSTCSTLTRGSLPPHWATRPAGRPPTTNHERRTDMSRLKSLARRITSMLLLILAVFALLVLGVGSAQAQCNTTTTTTTTTFPPCSAGSSSPCNTGCPDSVSCPGDVCVDLGSCTDPSCT